MKGRNLYKDIVIGGVLVFLAVFCVNLWKDYRKEQQTRGFYIQRDRELTEKTAEQLRNISGLCRFEPSSSVRVTLQLEEFTLETGLTGVDLESYPLEWKKVDETFSPGNTSALFFGKDMFQMFSDKHGYSPDNGQIKIWMDEYQNLTLSITDEKGHVKKGRISGILKHPAEGIFMDKRQMEEIFRQSCQATGGYLEVYGYRNMKKARDELEGGGFLVEEADIPET